MMIYYFSKLSAILITIPFSLVCLFGAEAAPDDKPKKDSDEVVARRAAHERQMIEALEQEVDKSAGSELRTQTYRFLVLDQHGKPVGGIPVGVTSSVRRSNFVASGFLSDATDVEVRSDERGEVIVKPAPFHILSVGVVIGRKDVVNVYRQPDRMNGMQQVTEFCEADIGLSKPNSEGYHGVFRIHRYGNRDPLASFQNEFRIPLNDRNPYAILLSHPRGKKITEN